jgi:hypothetical protein
LCHRERKKERIRKRKRDTEDPQKQMTAKWDFLDASKESHFGAADRKGLQKSISRKSHQERDIERVRGTKRERE